MQVNTNDSIEESQRLIHLDILRGFALFGILLVNFQWFSRPLQATHLGYDTSLTGVNFSADWLISWLAEGKFYPLFSLLFGIGFTLMAERAAAKGVRFWTVYGRRVFLLALIGLLHIVFIWTGDILLNYAMAATVMLLVFRRTPVQRLWKWSLVLIGAAWPLIGIVVLASTVDPSAMIDFNNELAQEKAELIVDVERANAIYSDGSFTAVAKERIQSYLSFMSSQEPFGMLVLVGYFLLGRWLAVSGRVIDLHTHRRFFKRWAVVGLPAGLILSATATALMYQGDIALLDTLALVGGLFAAVAGVVLPLGYMAAVFLAASKLTWLAPVGRMALSQYLLQSLVWTSVFYGYGLGLWGQVPRILHIPIVVAFFALQIVISHWWLRRYRFGPVEWLWRSFTYWRWQSMKSRPEQ